MAKRSARLLVVDDDAGVVDWLVEALAEEGYTVAGLTDSGAVLAELAQREFDVLISDVEMPGLRGIELLHAIEERRHRPLVILITAFGSIDLAVQAVKAGAADFLAKPFRIEALVMAVERALRERRLRQEITRLRATVAQAAPGELVAHNPAMRRAVELGLRAANSDVPVLLTGESGVGKGVLARLIHDRGPRRAGPFVQINCSALPSTLVEAELFGVRRGAFTGAHEDRPGIFQQASGGTLLLDEVGELPAETQPKLLQALETGRVRAVGATAETEVDVRILAATNRPLEEALARQRFRPDLYHRLNVIRLPIPPLRERPEDLEPLVDQILARIGGKTGRSLVGVSAEAMRWMRGHTWPGNVRELANALERAVALSDHDLLELEDLAALEPGGSQQQLDHATAGHWSLAELEQHYIRAVLRQTGGNKAEAARILGVDRRTLYRKVADLDADAADEQPDLGEEG
jgi:DNA-binding NtrC family response regulator